MAAEDTDPKRFMYQNRHASSKTVDCLRAAAVIFRYVPLIIRRLNIRDKIPAAVECLLCLQQNYLMKFGYLPQSDLETGNLRTDDQLTDAIKNLQRFGGIPVTGDIDEATMKLMRLPRCGLPDKVDPRYTRVRHKRYTIHGQQWPHRNLTWRRKHKIKSVPYERFLQIKLEFIRLTNCTF
ncbi:Matrix metalloproteinase-17 [Apis cerana cerana]|uniref:Matrix metalloproteinase-17 n=1 Tax=Apis cerana cerana TaxID=94128 RepID=A0A2A3EGV3_APICC|nr:Matrix metalloproteinase-17 [Apis cerana cerana]